MLTYDETLQQLTTDAPRIPAPTAITQAPNAPGLYAIFVDDSSVGVGAAAGPVGDAVNVEPPAASGRPDSH